MLAILSHDYHVDALLECPAPTTAGICVELCKSSGDCGDQELCCYNGCGHVCTHACPPRCAIQCLPGYQPVDIYDEDGCQSCDCQKENPCALVDCAPEFTCEVKPVEGCSGLSCQTEAECVPFRPGPDNYQCPAQNLVVSAASCPSECGRDDDCYYGDLCCQNSCGGMSCTKGECGPFCEIGCPIGKELKRDRFGCFLCECVDLCENIHCSFGESCQVESHAGGPKAVCKDCRTSSCPACPTGLQNPVDWNGCVSCTCEGPCEQNDVQCGFGNFCENIQTSSGFTALCKPCPVLNCPKCPAGYGYKMDPNTKCQTCECFDVCKDYPCGPGESCVADDVTCIAPPCNPVARCTRSECNDDMCGACPPNTIPRRDSNQCQIPCQCYNPCETIKCPSGPCILQQVQCAGITGPCDPQPICTDTPCPGDYCPPCPYNQAAYRYNDGCKHENCQCYNPCAVLSCPYGEDCDVRQKDYCSNPPCDPVASCRAPIDNAATSLSVPVLSLALTIITSLLCLKR